MSSKTLLVVDLFCGAGGASEGLRRSCEALGQKMSLLAVNHSPVAVTTHRRNHPQAVHLCESIERVDPTRKVFVDPETSREFRHRGRIDLLIAAPECTFFSTARGGRPVTDQQRTQPWIILKWLQELYVENLLIENVPEFAAWGPIGANGKPLKSQRGRTFRAFLDTIAALGYKVEHRILNAADYGDPTTRRRLFIIARRGGKAIAWPTPTHSRTGARTLFGNTKKKWRAAREVIDWSIEGKSIFGRKKPLSPKTMARILAGLERFGGAELTPFLVILRNHADARSIDDPVPTLAAQGQHVGLCEPFIMPVTHGGDASKRERSVNDPFPTITGAHRGELAVVEPFILQQQSGGVPRTTDEPLPTVATDGAQMLVEPFLVGYHSEKRGEQKRVASVDEPLPTLTTENRFAVVEPFIVPPRGFSEGPKVDSVDAPLRTIVAASGHNFAVVEPFLIPHFGERPTQTPRVHAIDEPVPTIAATGQIDIVEPFLASYYGTQNISPVSAPVPTITTKDRCALVIPVVNGRALDIRLRMLKPHELARAMSFGDDYQFAGNQGEQVKQIGNAWPCALGQALITSLLRGSKAGRRPQLEAIA